MSGPSGLTPGGEQRALEVVDDGDEVARDPGLAAPLGVGRLAGGPLAVVLEVRAGPLRERQVLVALALGLGQERVEVSFNGCLLGALGLLDDLGVLDDLGLDGPGLLSGSPGVLACLVDHERSSSTTSASTTSSSSSVAEAPLPEGEPSVCWSAAACW